MSLRKLLLAHLRQGDYAHAGEEEAIELMLPLIPKNPDQKLLDLGCGLGGTAAYIEKRGFGKVTGVDIDGSVLEKAKSKYPNLAFHKVDVTEVNHLFKGSQFDLFYSFNAFFCFKDQAQCLKACADIASENAELLIFDYTSSGPYLSENPFGHQSGSTAAESFIPIDLNSIETLLLNSGWQLKSIVDLTDQYRRWYQVLLVKMSNIKTELVQKFGEVPFFELYFGFSKLLNLIEEQKLGGSFILGSKYAA